MKLLSEQQEVYARLERIVDIFINSECQIRPHFWLTGPSGCGKSHLISTLADNKELHFVEINAAQLTREGVSGNSLSKALSPLLNKPNKPTIVFVDEFDKLFVSGNSNSEAAHDATTAVQNEFLKVVESDKCQVFGDYGKYITVNTANVLFIFAGAFNGKEQMDLDTLQSYGVKTEFLGRVSLLFEVIKPTLDSLQAVVDKSVLMLNYLALHDTVDPDKAKQDIKDEVAKQYEKNTLGVRMVNTLIHQYFIYEGKFGDTKKNKSVFQKKLEFKPKQTH